MFNHSYWENICLHKADINLNPTYNIELNSRAENLTRYQNVDHNLQKRIV